MHIGSKTAFAILFPLLGLGALVGGCASEDTTAPQTAAPGVVRYRASHATTEATSIALWDIAQVDGASVARGRGEDGALIATLEMDGKISPSSVGATAVMRVGFKKKSATLRFGDRGLESAVGIDDDVQKVLVRAAADARSASDTTRAPSSGGIGTRDWEDECYECAGRPSAESSSRSSSSAAASSNPACEAAVFREWVAGIAAAVACMAPEPLEVPACYLASLALAAATASRVAACIPKPSQLCYASYECTAKYGPGWSCSGGACVSSGIVTPGRCKVNGDCNMAGGEVCGLDGYCRPLNPSGGGGGQPATPPSGGGGGGGAACNSDWDCGTGYICTSNYTCGS